MEKSAKFRWQKNMFVSPFINPSLPSFFLAQRWHLSFSHLHSGERQWCQKSNRHRCCRDNKWCVVEGWKEKRGIPVEISVIFPFSNEIKQKRPFLFHGGLFGKGLPPSLKQFSAFWSAGMHEFELRKFPFFAPSLPPLSLWFVIVEEEEELLFSFRTQAKKSVLSSPFSLSLPFFVGGDLHAKSDVVSPPSGKIMPDDL